MSEDVRRAAERLRREGTMVIVPTTWPYDAMRTLAEAYLAEHPADDGEPVTGDWLAKIGPLLVGGRELDVAVDGYVQLWIEGDAGAFAVPLCHAETRGDVRRLCRALGIPLKE